MSFFWGMLVSIGVAHFIYTISESVRYLDEWMQGHYD